MPALLSLCVEAAVADDADRKAETKALVNVIKEIRKQKDATALGKALERAVSLHNNLTSNTERHSLQHVVGQVLTDKNMGADRIAAAEALGKLNDPKGAFKHLKRALPTAKTEAAGPVELAALKALASVASDSSIPSLLELMRKAKDHNVAKHAISALGSFGSSKKRVTVLEEMGAFLRLVRPRRGKGTRIGAATRARWNALRSPLLSSLNRLTGQNQKSADGWIALLKDFKKTLKKLFVDKGD